MKKIDSYILNELKKDAQMPFSKIAKKLGISPTTVKKRYRKLKDEGVILRSSISVDISKLGYHSIAFLMIKCSKNVDKQELINSLKKFRNIFAITEITGEFNVFTQAAVRNLKDFTALVNDINSLPGVDRTEFSLIDDVWFPQPPRIHSTTS